MFDPAFPSAVVRGPDLPAPAEGLYAFAPIILFILVLSLWGLVRHRRERARGRRRAGFMAGLALSSALGNVLVEFNAMFDPSRPVAMLMQDDTERTIEAPGDERDPPVPSPVVQPFSPERP